MRKSVCARERRRERGRDRKKERARPNNIMKHKFKREKNKQAEQIIKAM